MTNVNTHPNSLALTGDVHVTARFGSLLSVTPVAHIASGHPVVVARFAFGLRLELCPTTAVELTRGITEALVALPSVPADCSGACDLEAQGG